MKRIQLVSLGLVITAAIVVWLGSSVGAPPNQNQPSVDSAAEEPVAAPTLIELPGAVDAGILVEDPPNEPAQSAGGTSAGSKKRIPASAAGTSEPGTSRRFDTGGGQHGGGALRGADRNAVLSVALKHARGEDVAAALQELYPGVGGFQVDPRTKALLIYVPQSQVEVFKKAAQLLDKSNPDAELEIKIFTLQNSDAAEIARLLMQLYPAIPYSIVPDNRTNTLIVRGPKGDGTFLSEFEALVMRLDVPESSPLNTGKLPVETKPSRSRSDTRFPTGLHAADDADVNVLRQKYQALENQATELANSTPRSPLTKEQNDSLAKKLTEAVSQAFDARQQLQRAEVAAIARQLELTNQRIAEREKIRQQIVDRRVNDLLTPQARWDQSKVETPSRDAQSSNIPVKTRPVESDYSVRPAATTIAVDSSTTQLSQATAIAKRFDELRRQMDSISDVLKVHPRHERAGNLQVELENARKEHDLLIREHQVRLQLLELDSKQAQSDVENAGDDLKRIEKLKSQNVVSATEFTKATREFESAKLRLERAMTVYRLFSGIDPRIEASKDSKSKSSAPQSRTEPVGEVKEID